jgi:hypothetical protein
MNSRGRQNYGEDPGAIAMREEGFAGEQAGIVAPLWRATAEAWAACGAFEWVALGYLALSSMLLAVFAENVAHPVRMIGTQAFVAALILILCSSEARSNQRAKRTSSRQLQSGPLEAFTFEQKFWHFWRHWYPHLFFLFCFEELGKLVHLVSPGWQDARLIAADYWLTGVHPAIWLEQFATPARNDFMQFAYLTYFAYLLVVGGVLYYRKDWQGYWSVMTYSAVAYGIGYVIAISFPIESPWFSMAGVWHADLRGGPFTAAINFIEHYGRVLAGSSAALWGAWRHRRWLFRVMLPLVLCLCVSTVWGRYHYVVDIFGGMVTGTLGYLFGNWIMRRPGAVATDTERVVKIVKVPGAAFRDAHARSCAQSQGADVHR